MRRFTIHVQMGQKGSQNIEMICDDFLWRLISLINERIWDLVVKVLVFVMIEFRWNDKQKHNLIITIIPAPPPPRPEEATEGKELEEWCDFFGVCGREGCG